MSDRVTIHCDRDGLTGAHQLAISKTDERGMGGGCRLAGPKYSGTGANVITARVDERAAGEIRHYLDAVFPLDLTARWQALKDYLSGCITADEAVRVGMVNDGETEKAAPFGGLVSANRSTLKKMRELEQS